VRLADAARDREAEIRTERRAIFRLPEQFEEVR
jgi:hypothetical protein